MDYPRLIFFAFFALITGSFLYRRLKHGSWTGAFLKGRVENTIGEVALSRGVGGSQTLAVHAMKSAEGEENFVGLVVISKAPMAASMQPFKLSKAQAQELASYLIKAAQ